MHILLHIFFFKCCSFKEEGKNLLHIAIEDNIDSDIYSKFQPSCEFIGKLI